MTVRAVEDQEGMVHILAIVAMIGHPFLLAVGRVKLSPAGSALVYSTYLGGSGDDEGRGIAVDESGAYVTGYTESGNFPTQSPFQPSFGGGFGDAFVAKLSPAGSALMYSTYLGGSGDDAGFGIAVDGSGAYVTGFTTSTDFPTQFPCDDSAAIAQRKRS